MEIQQAGWNLEKNKNLGKLLNSRKIEKVSIDLINIKKGHFAQNILEGLIDSQYKFDHYKVEKKEPTLKEVLIYVGPFLGSITIF